MEYKKALEIIKHVDNLSKIFNLSFEDEESSPEQNKLNFFKILNRLENRAHKLTTLLCNENNLTEAEQEEEANIILRLLNMRLGFKENNIPIFINYDPRGYALKIKDNWIKENNIRVYTDLGGYGIIAPSF